MSEPNIREIAETFNGTAWDGTHVGAIAADWLRLTAPLGDEKLADIEAREKAATPGPWKIGPCGDNRTHVLASCKHAGYITDGTETDEDWTWGSIWYASDDFAVGSNLLFCADARTDIPALLQEIRRLTTARCQIYLGGYQPVPIRCGLDAHTGQHAGIGENGKTVTWPEQSSDISGQLRASEAAREKQGREIAGLRKALLKIVFGSERRFSQDPPTEEFQSLRDHDSGARLAWSAAAKIARVALTHTTCPDCDGAGVLNAGSGGHDHCDRCGTTGRVRR